MFKRKQLKKWIVIMLGIVLVLQISVFSLGQINSNAQAKSIQNPDEKRIATELSNMTGVKVEKILSLKHTGKTWNQVIYDLKADPQNNQQADNRSSKLAENGIDEAYMKKLTQDGFSKDQIITVKMKVERVLFQLEEITKTNNNDTAPKLEQLATDNKSNSLADYQKIYQQFNTKTAIYLILHLQKDLGSLDAVLDEYLLSLQLGINLEDYLIDKEKYQKEKKQKNLTLTQGAIITLAKIEEKMLETIQKQNQANASDLTNNDKNKNNPLQPEVKTNDPSINIPKSNVEEIKPINPTDEIQKEIQQINPNP